MREAVLIVDDSLTVRMDLAGAFEDAGFSALPCSTLAEAREAVLREPVRAAVLDVLLPDGNGIDLLAELRASPVGTDIAILMLSTEADVKDRIRGLKTGADEYVGKPYDTKHVVARARELLGGGPTTASDQATVLIVDDSMTYRAALGEALEEANYAVLTAASAEEGLSVIADRRPNIVITDGQLPGMDGAALIRRVRLDAALRGIPCLLLTGSDDHDAELHAFEAGADAFIRKQEDIEVILAKIAAALRATGPAHPVELGSLVGLRKILVATDNAGSLRELGDLLRAEGYDVVPAHSGQEALDLLAVQPVDCILLDILMPGIEACATCERIKATPVLRDIPLILLAPTDDRAAMLEGLGAGADDCISRSSQSDVLRARVRAQIRRKQFEDENRRIREELLRNALEASEARAAKDLAEARAALVRELEIKNKELEAFSYSVSHDLRAPLRAIDGFSKALQQDCGKLLDSRGHDHLKRVRAGAQRMAELIDDMLLLSRVTRAELNRSDVDISALTRNIVADLQRQHADHEVEIHIDDDLVVQADERLMRIVLENLLGNAWKFTRGVAKPVVEVRGNDGSESGFLVRDNGAGFDMAYVGKLFRPFHRLHTEAEFPGTGIGLAIIQRIMDRHGARISAEGEVGKGAAFYADF